LKNTDEKSGVNLISIDNDIPKERVEELNASENIKGGYEAKGDWLGIGFKLKTVSKTNTGFTADNRNVFLWSLLGAVSEDATFNSEGTLQDYNNRVYIGNVYEFTAFSHAKRKVKYNNLTVHGKEVSILHGLLGYTASPFGARDIHLFYLTIPLTKNTFHSPK